MLEQVLRHLNNWFLVEIHEGTFAVENGSIALPFLLTNQYFRICGSVFNDGLHQYPAADLKRIESTRQEISERVDESSSQVIQATHQQITDLQQNVNSIILSALENYVETGDFDSYKEEVSTKLSVLTDQLSIDITKVTERIDKVDGDLQSKYSEITKAFRFTSDGLIIGETGNEILLRLDNDVLQFVRNNTPELQITAEGVEAMRIKVSILCIGNVVWTEDENGDVIAS